MTELCQLALKYGTDKCPQIRHPYTPVYYELLNGRRDSVKKVLEMGIGEPTIMEHIENYKIGASLKMWRDFFPNAMIYGADNLTECMFEEDRIKTFLCDETVDSDISRLIEQTGSDIDLFIDDAIHRCVHQEHLCATIMPLLKKDVIYIVEDTPMHLADRLVRHMIRRGYDSERLELPYKDRHEHSLVRVRNKI